MSWLEDPEGVDREVLVLEDSGEIVGIVMHEDDDGDRFVNALAIRSDNQAKGLGKLVLGTILDDLSRRYAGHVATWLVAPANFASHAMSEAVGADATYPAETKPNAARRDRALGVRAGEQDERGVRNGTHRWLRTRDSRGLLAALFAAWNPICPGHSDRGTASGVWADSPPLRALTRIFGRFGRSQVDRVRQVSASPKSQDSGPDVVALRETVAAVSRPAVPFSFVPDDPEGPEEKPLVEKVRGWLETQGYPLELTTARKFRRNGAEVQVGQFYTDPDTGEAREIDVIATFRATHNAGLGPRSSFVVECKRSVHQPWVMFARPGVVQDLPLQGRVYHSCWRSENRRGREKLVAVPKLH